MPWPTENFPFCAEKQLQNFCRFEIIESSTQTYLKRQKRQGEFPMQELRERIVKEGKVLPGVAALDEK